ncbi:MAG: trypsin-like serine protease [Actinomycetota bacterium]|nr:trypsin-like serine protease [Actinomycetota bacterium]
MKTRFVAIVAAIFMCCIPSVAQAVPQSLPRIIGGNPSTIDQSPWQVLIIMRNSMQCSGTLVAATTIVTAAHCLNGYTAGDVRVWAGISKTSERSPAMELAVASITPHPEFRVDTFDNDIGLITLSRPIDLTGKLQLLALPFGQDARAWPASGVSAVVSGWGVTNPIGTATTDQLMRAEVLVLAHPNAPCGQYGPDVDPVQDVCAGSPTGAVDACQGDSGGPLVVSAPLPTLAGVVSFGTECAQAGYPGLYTRLTTFLPWLQSKIDLPVAPPAAPSGVVVRASQGRVDVSWTPPVAAGAASTKWTVTAAPGGQTCSTVGSTCGFGQLTAGQEVTFTVQGSNSFGPGTASEATLPVKVTGGQSTVGNRVAVATLAAWLGLGADSVTRVLVLSPRVCVVAGAKVRMKAAGNCVVQLNQGGKAQTVTVRIVPSSVTTR